jgi:hypothetical protein
MLHYHLAKTQTRTIKRNNNNNKSSHKYDTKKFNPDSHIFLERKTNYATLSFDKNTN